MRATWRPLPAWPYPPAAKGKSSFQVGWDRTLEDLEAEIERTGGSDVVIGVVAEPSEFTFAGTLRAHAKLKHVGVEVSFAASSRRLTFHTDAFGTLQENLRAVSLGLTALRAIERYGIGSGGEQYAGFAQLSAGGPDAARGRALVERAGGMRQALMLNHPDHGGKPKDFADVQAYREQVDA